MSITDFKSKSIEGYKVLKTISESYKSVVYHAKSIESGDTVIIKSLKKEIPTRSDIARIRQECSIIEKIDSQNIVKSLGVIEQRNSIALALEDIQGTSIKDALKGKKLDMKNFLRIAAKIARAIGEVHHSNVVHRDIKPHNIVVKFKDNTFEDIRLTDFGISVIMQSNMNEIFNPEILEGTLPYISPEQTGRMNRPVDYRTDLYSLGITFYELLCGTVPFRSQDPLELIHFHLAIMPESPAEKDPSIPGIVSDIVMRLIAKAPEERYQNAFGLLYDLEECLKRLNDQGEIEAFTLGRKDISERFNIPQILFGRDTEKELLIAAFERMSQSGAKELLLVSGAPGIGKSYLINEIHRPIVKMHGYFISGKYDQLRRDVPHSSIIQSFQGLIKQILTESSVSIENWKKKIKEALGTNGQLMIDVIPALKHIIGDQPAVEDLAPEAARNRFNYVFVNFVKVFTQKKHPLVLFLDDMQWADTASIDFVKTLLTDFEVKHLMIICSYRNNEVNDLHPFSLMLKDLDEKGNTINTLILPPLSQDHVRGFIYEHFRSNDEKYTLLADIVYSKTFGNPFFMIQFLKSLFNDRILTCDPVDGWKWDQNILKSLYVTDNVVELMAEKITKLSEESQNILKTCSCIGNRFDLEMISILHNKTIEECLNDLQEVLHERLIYYGTTQYCFLHDRIQEAAYSIIGDEEKERMHNTIGHHLLGKTKEEEMHEMIFYITDQLNRGTTLIKTEEESYKLAELNLMACIKAKMSAAFGPAYIYIKQALKVLVDTCWDDRYELTLSIYNNVIETAHLNNDLDEMEKYSETVITKARTLLDQIRSYEVTLVAYGSQNKFDKTIQTGMHLLKKMNISFPKKPNKLHIIRSFIKTKIALIGKNIPELINYKKCTEPKVLGQMSIIYYLATPVYMSQPIYYPLISLKMLLLSLKHGNSFYSSFSFSTYSLMLSSLGDFDTAQIFSDLAIKLAEKNNSGTQICRANFVYYGFVYHWKYPLHNITDEFLTYYQLAIESGDIENAGNNIHLHIHFLYFKGSELDYFIDEVKKFSAILIKYNLKLVYDFIKIYHQTALNLMGKNNDPLLLKGDVYDIDEMMHVHITNKASTTIAIAIYFTMYLAYIFENYELAAEKATEIEGYFEAMAATEGLCNTIFYSALTYIKMYEKTGKKGRLKKVLSYQKKLQTWAHHAPMNRQHKYELLQAEITRVKGNSNKAEEHYNKAITAARQNKFLHEEALFNELAAKFFFAQEDIDKGNELIKEAHYCYNRWGALAKVQRLEETYPMLQEEQKEKAASVDTSTYTSTGTLNLDISTILKASQNFTSEMDLCRLLKRVMNISIENAGAQKGYLIMENEDDKKLYIEAESTAGEDTVVLQSIPVNESTKLSPALVNYVHTTGEDVVLGNASEEGMYSEDPYVLKNKVKSVLCAPITYKGKMTSIIYLENNLTANTFTPQRIELLRILSSQAAISIENARLLAERENTARLEKEMEIAANIQTSLVPHIPRIEGYEIIGFIEPAEEVGGDYYDVINTEDRDWLIIGDVSGHGLLSGLFMMMVQTSIQVTLAHFPEITPSELMTIINKGLYDNIDKIAKGKYMTMTILSHEKNGEFKFSGLHQNILIYRAQSNTVDVIESAGKWIGFKEDLYAEELSRINHSLKMNNGDVMLLFTDGITEALDNDNNMFGYALLVRVFEESGAKNPADIKNRLLSELKDYTADDDVTFLIIKKKEKR